VEQLIELLKQIQELAGVAVDALEGAAGDAKGEGEKKPMPEGEPKPEGGPPAGEGAPPKPDEKY
jgi:hypothetical protein